MSVDKLLTESLRFGRIGINIVLLLSILFTLLKMYGFDVPIRTIDTQAILYLAGAYWLIK